jgi:hypothetical protein
MMVANPCNDVQGDDTNRNGFRLIVDNDDECNCKTVRSLGAGRNTRVRVDNNILSIDITEDIQAPSGGGLITVNLVIQNAPSRLQRTLTFSWSDPLIIQDTNGNDVSVPMKLMTNTVNFHSFFIYNSDTSIFTEGITTRGFFLRPNDSIFILDPPLSITFPPGREPRPITITARVVRVAATSLNNWKNQRIFDGSVYLLAVFDCNTPLNERFIWKPNNISFPANQNATQERLELTLTYDTRTNTKSWLDNVDLDRFKSGVYNIFQSLGGGGNITYTNTGGQFTFVKWTRPIIISHAPGTIQRNGSFSIGMPPPGSEIRYINTQGIVGTSTIRDLGIEMGVNNKALFYVLPEDIQSDTTPSSGFTLVDSNAIPFNPNPLWILICCVSPSDRSLLWNPGRIVIPLRDRGSNFYDNVSGTFSWNNTFARQLNDSDPDDEVAITGIKCEYPLVKFTKCNTIVNVDFTQLNSNLTTMNNRVSALQLSVPTKRFISAVVRFDDLVILNSWGVQVLKTVRRNSTGIIQVVFPVDTTSINYGVLLSMNIDNKAGIIQYSNQTRSSVNVLTFDLKEELTNFSGSFTIDIII